MEATPLKFPGHAPAKQARNDAGYSVLLQILLMTVLLCVAADRAGAQSDGSDGVLEVSGTVAIDDVKTAVSANVAAGDTVIQVNATDGFTEGQVVVLIQMIASAGSVGRWEEATVAELQAGALRLASPVRFAYSTAGSDRAQLIHIKQFTDVTVH